MHRPETYRKLGAHLMHVASAAGSLESCTVCRAARASHALDVVLHPMNQLQTHHSGIA